MVRGAYTVALKLLDEINQLPSVETVEMPSWTPVFNKAVIYHTVGDRTNCRRTLDELMQNLDPGTLKAAGYYLLWAGLALDELELERAREYLTLGFRISNQHYSPNQNIRIRLEYSRYYRLYNEPATALSWAEDAFRFAQQQPAPYFLGLALVAKAEAHWLLNDIRDAEENLAQAIDIFEPIQAQYDLARAFLLRAIWSRQSGKDSAAKDWVQAARCIIRSEYGFLVEKEQESTFPLIAAYMRSRDPEVRSVSDELLQRLASVPPPVLRIASMGQFGVWKGRRRIPDTALMRRKAGDLLRYLLLQPNRSAGREIIIEALWPDHNSDSPFDLLHQATSALRHALESDLPDKFPSRYLKVEGEWISLSLPNGSVVDFEQFEDMMPSAIQSKQIERLRKVLDLYHGDLFPSDRYCDWSAERRQFLAELYQRGLIALAEAHLEQEQYLNVIQCCRNVLKIDPWNENAVLLSMQAFIGLDNVPQAMQSFLELEKVLKRDLNIAPRYDLRRLAQTLQNR
jgi:DNA-binding SARP family transcriptional activator